METKAEKLEEIQSLVTAHKFCSACGGEMSLRRIEKPAYDTQTGEAMPVVSFVWGCVMGQTGHDWLDV